MSSPSTDIVECFVCGRSMIRRETRFCSDRCREAFDLGFPPHDPNQVRALNAVPLGDWIIVAGPPDARIGERCWGFIVDLPRRVRKRRKASSGPLSTNSKIVKKNPIAAGAYKSASADSPTPPDDQSRRSGMSPANDNVPARRKRAG